MLSSHLAQLLDTNGPGLVHDIVLQESFWAELVSRKVLTREVKDIIIVSILHL